MKICKKILITLLISIILLYSIIPSKTVFADEGSATLTQKEAGDIIADFATNMVEQHASETVYDYGSSWRKRYDPFNSGKLNPYYKGSEQKYENWGRQQAYKGIKVTGYAQSSPDRNTGNIEYREETDKYFMDCVGFVSFCIHNSLGIYGIGGDDMLFVVPGAIRDHDHFEYVTDGSLKRGDIMYSSGHVMIYLGNNQYAESSDINNPSWQIKFRTGASGFSAARIKPEAAAKIFKSQTKTSWDGKGTSGGGGSGGGIVTPEVDDSEAFEQYIGQGNLDGLGDSNKFYYNGVPKSGEYLGKVEKENWLFNTLNDAADWLLGLATMNIKIQVIGWTNIFEWLANDIVEAFMNEDFDGERITVEDIIYNKVSILDVNFFNLKSPSEPSSEEITGEESFGDNNAIVYVIRQKIASWYVIIRTVCIILLLFSLLYLGIRTAISSVASDKAEYKKKLVAWVVSFIVVMFIHYYMLMVLNLNDIALKWIAPPEGSTSVMYEQMRAYAYEIPASKGWMGTIMYVFLVYYLIKMLFFYFKRLLIVYILAIISPAMGVAYSIQRINGKSKALGMWMKEFAFNVLIQFVHAVTYTIIMGVIVGNLLNAKILDLGAYIVLLLITLNFLLDSEDLIKNIFKIQSNSLKSVLSTALDFKNRFAVALGIGGFIYGKGKSAVVKGYEKHLTANLNDKYDKYKIQGDSEIAKATNAEIDRLKEAEKNHIMEANSNAINFAKKQFVGAVGLVTGIPAMFENPLVGVTTLVGTATGLNTTFEAGKYGHEARNLEKSTEGSGYIYIDAPQEGELQGNDGANSNNGNSQSGSNGANNNNGNSKSGSNGENNDNGNSKTGNNGANNNNGNQRTVRTYNTEKNKKYTVSKAIASWLTVGRSTIAKNAVDAGRKERDLVQRVYSTRIEKISVVGNMAVKEIGNINTELNRIKRGSYPPVYYTPKKDESKTQVAMNEKLRQKYRTILEKNVIQIYEGVDKEKVSEHVVNYEANKMTTRDLENIAKEYLKENECNTSLEFKENLDKLLKQKIVDTVDKKGSGFEKIKLKPDLEQKIADAVKETGGKKKKLDEKLDTIITEEEKDQVVSKLSVKDLTDLISKTLEKKGSIEVNRDFKNLQKPIENLRQLNAEAKATVGNEIYSTEKLLDLIMNKDIME